MIQASAPGKLMLAGEYVVAAGKGPALSVSVEQRARVRITAAGVTRWVVDAPGLGLSGAELRDLPMVAEAVALFPGGRVGRIAVESDLGVGRNKPGLGGSSAICVAACKALAAYTERPEPSLADMVAAHRRGQGGVGSGYDIATALHGGVILYHSSSYTAGPPKIEALEWPEGLHGAIFFSGRGASTRHLLEKVADWRNEDVESYEACIEPLIAESSDFIEAFRRGEVGAILTQAAQLQEELAFFDKVGDIGIISTGPIQLAGAIEDAGAIARTAGAGGGDCMWALSDTPESIERAAEAAAALGFERLDLAIGGLGARVDTEST